ncbi:uncharacterized protein VTP21DRAFT_537 [Calcarisporiella thermophila]|uniref:uncharacterized protein n=1 Tax=Calcarisporiella thermophila TaxID=911321 RepID=UPI0037438E64
MEDDDLTGSLFYSPATAAASSPASSFASGLAPSITASIFAPSDFGNPWFADVPTTSDGIDVKTLLAGALIDPIYNQAFQQATPVGGSVSVSSLHRVISLAGLPPSVTERILNLAVASNTTRVSRGEFNVALALAAMAQKGMDVSLDNLANHKDDIPTPSLPGLENLKVDVSSRAGEASSTSQTNDMSSVSFPDPWSTAGTNGYSSKDSETFAQAAANRVAPAVPSGRIARTNEEAFQWYLDMDTVKVNISPEREGFLFKHVNYIVESQRHGSTVVRRYSDFWWLMEVLVQRYPFRILPHMPPKKIGGMDDGFLEKRRKGLVRFINFIARHPILRDDDLVLTFLTEPMEMALWRRQNIFSLEDEFKRLYECGKLSVDVRGETCDLENQLDRVRKRLPKSIEYYQNMCLIVERLARRWEGTAADFVRYGLSLNSLCENEKECHVEGCSYCPQLLRGYEMISAHMQRGGSILEDQTRAAYDGILESLKRHRDLLVSLRNLFERKDRLGVDTIDTLQKRIQHNQNKLDSIRETPGQESLFERLTSSIEQDQKDIEYQQKRNAFISTCLLAELRFYHSNHAFVSMLYQNFVHDQVKFLQRQLENWKLLSDAVYDMPVDAAGFA